MISPLDMPDICSIICQLSRRDDLCRLARVSGDWRDSATPFIWENLPNIFYLFALLPGASLSAEVDLERILTLCRPIKQDDWLPVLRYGRFVRCLGRARSNSYRIIPSEGLTRNVLACPPPAPLCPMLRELGLAGITGNAARIPDAWLPIMFDMLLGENLDTLYLTVGQLNDPLSLDPSQLVKTCPHLQTLGLHFISAAGGQLSTLFNAFYSHTHLRAIDLLACDIPVQVPESLSRLPYLSKLSMMELSAICNHSTPNYAPDSFPALTSLVLGGNGMHPTTLHTMMGAWTTRRPLQSVVLQTTDSRTDMQGWKLQHTTQCIQQHCDPVSLRKIIIHSPEPSGGDLERHDMSALSSFRNLTTLRINLIDGRCALTDDDLAAMASWWPAIEELCIMPDKTSDLGILPTLSSLSTLARSCPRLHTLELPFSAQLIPPVVASQQSLTKMSIMWYAPIDDSDGVLQFLRSTFPKLRRVSFGGYSGRIMYLDGTFPRSRAWDSVVARLKEQVT